MNDFLVFVDQEEITSTHIATKIDLLVERSELSTFVS